MSNWFSPTVPARVKPFPWLAPKAIEYFESLLTPDMEVMEHGAGGSTLWLAERVKYVTSIEHDLDWYAILRKRVPSNVTLVVGLGVLYVKPVDLLFIDGEPVERRADWISAAAQLVKPGGYVVLDNANRPEYEKERQRMRQQFTEIHVVDSNYGGFLYLKTEFYRL